MTIRVLVVDDHRLVRLGLTRMIAKASAIDVVGEADCGEAAITQTRTLRPDVVLMDLRMPGIGGLEATRRIASLELGTRVLVVSALEEEPFPAHAMKAGAMGFVTKGASAEDLERAIRRVFIGQKYMSDTVAHQLAMRSFDPQLLSPFDLLSNREMQITMMVVGCHRVQQISKELHLSPKTVNSYRYRIFEKLRIASDVELTLLAVRHGVVDVARADA